MTLLHRFRLLRVELGGIHVAADGSRNFVDACQRRSDLILKRRKRTIDLHKVFEEFSRFTEGGGGVLFRFVEQIQNFRRRGIDAFREFGDAKLTLELFVFTIFRIHGVDIA